MILRYINSIFTFTFTFTGNVEAGMGGNGNELSGAIREWEWFLKCVNFGMGMGRTLREWEGL